MKNFVLTLSLILFVPTLAHAVSPDDLLETSERRYSAIEKRIDVLTKAEKTEKNDFDKERIKKEKEALLEKQPEMLTYDFSQFSAAVNEKDGLSDLENQYFEKMKEVDSKLKKLAEEN